MFFLRRHPHTNTLFNSVNILKFHDKIALKNSILINKFFKHEIAGLDFSDFFILAQQGGPTWIVLKVMK